jgi:hypothetical protein
MAGLASINVKFRVDLKQFSTEMQSALREIDKFGQKMQSVGRGMSAAITAPVLLAGGAAIKFASDYEESMNKVDVAFKTSSSQVKTFAKDTLENFGIAEGSALEMASLFGDMATSMGLPESAAAKMSTSLVGLAGDLSSFKNIGIEQAQTALAGIFTGETESLKKLGIVMTEAALQEYAYAQGIRTKVADMGQAEKVQLRYNYVLEKTKNAQGDFARTGGGAANQMRIFQEALKQLAQQFGSVILPAFTSVITKVNGIIISFGKLSSETKTAIVVVAGLAAAIGPLLSVVGSMLTFVPRLVVQMNALKVAAIANPYTAAALAIAALVGGIVLLANRTQEAVTEKQKLNQLYKESAINADKEAKSLDSLYKTATDVSKSTKERKIAVDELQSLYPAYFKNIDDEVIKNGNAAKTYYALRDAIFAKAKASAIEGELQKRASDRLQKEIELENKIFATKEEIAKIKKGADVIVLQESSAAEKTARITATKNDLLRAQNKLLQIQSKERSDFQKEAFKEDELLINSLQKNNEIAAKLRQNELDLINAGIEGVKVRAEVEKKLIPGTIAFYEEQIKKLKEQQDEATTTAASYYLLGNEIAKVQEKINSIQQSRLDPINAPTMGVTFDVGKITGSTDKMQADLQAKANGLKSIVESMKAQFYDISAVMTETVTNLANNAAVGFGETIGAVIAGTQSLSSLFSGMLGVVSDFMKDLGKQLIAIGIARIAFDKLKISGFGAVAAGIALVALSSVISSKLQSGPRFENGGIVGGSSFYGDKIMARVNSGELILNQKQQSSLYGQLNTPGGPIVMIPDVKLKGEDIYVSFGRYEKKKNRLG